ncbi:MAG: ELM1/GtrOC1 family putative glycosyltransferase [Desulfobulbus sp.]|nr:ELM1/GtrOC1 family putative glycosyltransferase [Desulfobulbus sp.]
MITKKLHILVVRDGRPGHEKQSLGIVASLKKVHTVQVLEVRVDPGYKAVLRAAAVFFGAGLTVFSAFRPDLIIGTGSHTHLTLLALKKRLGGHAIVCMSPMAMLRGYFDLCCIPRHDQLAEGANILLTDGPPGLNSHSHQHEPRGALVLVGGIDEKSHVWNNIAIARQIASAIAAHPEFAWTLTTSPRTPPNFLDIFSQQDLDVAVNLCPFGSTAQGWLEEQLQMAEWVLVTEDSLSMIFEALSAGCHVATIPVKFKNENKFVRCLKDLKNRQLIAESMGGEVSNDRRCFNEADRCASEIIKRFVDS